MDIAFAHHLSLGYRGGGEKWLINTANDLSKRGHNVDIYALPILLEGSRTANVEKLLEGVTYHEGKRFHIKADVSYLTYNPLSFLTFQTKHPRIAGFHAQSYWAKANLHYGFYPLLAKVAYNLIGSLDVKGYDLIHMISRCYALDAPTVYIPNYVDSEAWIPIPKLKDFTVVFFSRNNWQKGHDIALALQKCMSSVKFRFSNGQIPESDMPRFVGECHVAIVPSRVDTFGLSVVEAAMCGVPTVTSPLNTHVSLDLPLFYANSVADYIRGIKRLQWYWENRHDIYRAYAGNLRQIAKAQYDKPFIMDRIEKMLLSVVN